jgi:hypothetical protein
MVVLAILTMASVGPASTGLGRFSKALLPEPRYTRAFMGRFLCVD